MELDLREREDNAARTQITVQGTKQKSFKTKILNFFHLNDTKKIFESLTSEITGEAKARALRQVFYMCIMIVLFVCFFLNFHSCIV
jgi:hypothetical protein